MDNVEQSVIDAVASLNVWPADATNVQRQLGDGPTNQTWLVEHNQELYVLRQVKPFAASAGLSLQSELGIIETAQSKMLAPALVASNQTSGIVLSRFVEGRVWNADDMRSKNQLTRLANTLQQLHDLNCDARRFDVRAALDDYARRSTDSQANQWRDDAVAQLDEIGSREVSICHNDLTAANIIDSGQLCLIDWEYAALGDPLFDLAVVATHHELDAALTEHLLFTYLGRQDSKAARDLNRWCSVYRNLLDLWLSLDEVRATA